MKYMSPLIWDIHFYTDYQGILYTNKTYMLQCIIKILIDFQVCDPQNNLTV